MQGMCIYISSKILLLHSFIGWRHIWPCTHTRFRRQLVGMHSPISPVDPGDPGVRFSVLDDYKLYPLSHLTSPKVMFTTLRYWSDSNSVLPQAHDVPKSSRKNTHILILAKYIIRCSTTRGKEPSIWKAEDTDSARLLLTPDDVFWCCSGWTLAMMRDKASDFHYNWDRCKISREQCFICYPLEG